MERWLAGLEELRHRAFLGRTVIILDRGHGRSLVPAPAPAAWCGRPGGRGGISRRRGRRAGPPRRRRTVPPGAGPAAP
ncbi:hypothetical protein C3B61_06800 [Cryobacterium zongtaii]|uniref:Uncharacterized protein n=1 Tax=Cryobacterium zongtaii TaxID=1259217 RepID=A0A2S3ZJ28_9MICO|nr:hypothetical protein C3B61_06800 [Cryobacterium zongtaii]